MSRDFSNQRDPCFFIGIVIEAPSRRRTKKFFGAAVFQKCCRGVGEQPTFAEQIVFEMVANYEPQATKKFFDPAIFQKCWRGSGRVALIAARRQRNPRAMLLAHGGGGEKSDSFSRRGEQDRPTL